MMVVAPFQKTFSDTNNTTVQKLCFYFNNLLVFHLIGVAQNKFTLLFDQYKENFKKLT